MSASPQNISAPKNVSRETLDAYVSLLLKWNAKINLIGPATEADIWSRHIEDSLQLVALIPDTAKTLADLGSGGGLPGMVIAIQCPHLSVTLVEQDQRKAAFLTEVKHRLNLANVTVKAIDIAKLEGKYDVVSARALASLDALLAFAKPIMGQGAIGLFPKGENHEAELEAAANNWNYKTAQKPSATHASASIITISQLTSKRTES